MRDFNSLVWELRKNLSLCGEKEGVIYLYEGTIDLLKELMAYVDGYYATRKMEVTDESSLGCNSD